MLANCLLSYHCVFASIIIVLSLSAHFLALFRDFSFCHCNDIYSSLKTANDAFHSRCGR